MDSSNLEYASFLIRLWRQPPGEDSAVSQQKEWLLQVEHIISGEKRYFSSLDGLYAYLQEQLLLVEDAPDAV